MRFKPNMQSVISSVTLWLEKVIKMTYEVYTTASMPACVISFATAYISHQALQQDKRNRSLLTTSNSPFGACQRVSPGCAASSSGLRPGNMLSFALRQLTRVKWLLNCSFCIIICFAVCFKLGHLSLWLRTDWIVSLLKQSWRFTVLGLAALAKVCL